MALVQSSLPCPPPPRASVPGQFQGSFLPARLLGQLPAPEGEFHASRRSESAPAGWVVAPRQGQEWRRFRWCSPEPDQETVARKPGHPRPRERWAGRRRRHRRPNRTNPRLGGRREGAKRRVAWIGTARGAAPRLFTAWKENVTWRLRSCWISSAAVFRTGQPLVARAVRRSRPSWSSPRK